MSNVFCPLPWNHLFVRANQDVFPCCETNLVSTKFDESIEKTANHPVFNKFRLDILNGSKLPPECRSCEIKELAGKQSLRLVSLKHHSTMNKEKAQAITQPDGSVRNFKLERLDIRSSNLCNYKCRFCGIISSNSWLNDHKLLGYEVEKSYDKKTGIAEFELPWEDLKQHLPYVKEVKLAGGEPVMMPGTYQLLEELISIGNTDAKIVLITNASMANYGNKNIIELIKKFKRSVIMLSVDGIGHAHEWLRSGKSDWLKVKQVIKDYTSFANYDSVHFHVGVSWMNMWHLEKFVREYPNHKFIFNPVTDPAIYSIARFPKEQVNLAAEHYKKLYGKEGRYTWFLLYTLLHNMAKKDEGEFDRKEFVRVTNLLDNSRKQDFRKAFPEHAKVLLHG